MESVGGGGMDGGMRIGEGEGGWWFGVWILRGGERTGVIRGIYRVVNRKFNLRTFACSSVVILITEGQIKCYV